MVLTLCLIGILANFLLLGVGIYWIVKQWKRNNPSRLREGDIDVRDALSSALGELLRRDSYLLSANANERSISHRLALYLESQFPGWDVDCEYNRNHDDVKRLQLGSRRASDQDTEAITVYPDIIVHHRSTDENLLVIEVKKTNSRESEEYDIRKLEAFKNELRYKHAVFVRLGMKPEKADIDAIVFV